MKFGLSFLFVNLVLLNVIPLEYFVYLNTQFKNISFILYMYPFKRILHAYTHDTNSHTYTSYITIVYSFTYICAYIETHIYTNTYMHAHRYTCIQTHAYIHTYIQCCAYACIHTYMQTHKHTQMRTCIGYIVHACILVFTYTQIVHSCIHIYVYART